MMIMMIQVKKQQQQLSIQHVKSPVLLLMTGIASFISIASI